MVRPLVDGRFEAHAESLRFVAFMDRGCSWWNKFQDRMMRGYFLAHEQIHFALAEAEARRLNRMLPEIVERTRAVGLTPEQADADARKKVLAELHEARRRKDIRDAAFDQDTSYGVDTRNQDRWWHSVHEELRSSTPAEHVPRAAD